MPRDAATWYDKLGPKVMKELERRLNTTFDAEKMPAGLIVKIAELYLKHLDKREEKEEEVEFMTALDAIDQEGLPIEKKIEILTDYIGVLDRDKATAVQRLEEIQNDLPQVHEQTASS